MKLNALLISILAFTVVLAGCIGDDGEVEGDGAETGDDGQVSLGSKGAIRGLVVDDNFRPVQLKEEWSQTPGEFQDVGFVLILETGQRFETNENGEFTVLPLDPGTYTVRVAADVHEAKDQTVSVVSGEFAEITVEARRQYSGGGTVLSQEFVSFIACSIESAGLSVAALPCGDLSGDSGRASFDTDYAAIASDIRGMVTEMRATEDGYYGVTLRSHQKDCDDHDGTNGCVFAEPEVEAGRYIHNVLYTGLQWDVDVESKEDYLQDGQDGYCTVDGLAAGTDSGCGRYFAPEFTNEFRTILFPSPSNREHTDPVVTQFEDVYEGNVYVEGYTPAVGVILGVKAQFLQTVFLYELPEEGIQDYCALCDDADIPE